MARFAGVPSLPIVPFKHAYVVMDGTPEVRNSPNIRDHDVALYIKIQGESCNVGGYETNPIMLDQVRHFVPYIHFPRVDITFSYRVYAFEIWFYLWPLDYYHRPDRE